MATLPPRWGGRGRGGGGGARNKSQRILLAFPNDRGGGLPVSVIAGPAIELAVLPSLLRLLAGLAALLFTTVKLDWFSWAWS